MSVAPIILSEGAPPERHAARVVSEMFRWLATEEPQLRDHHYQMLQGMGHKLGNPKAQKRFMARMQRDPKVRMRLLSSALAPGKRGKCTLSWLTWSPVTPDGAPGRPDDLIPPWVLCSLEVIRPRSRDDTGRVRLVTLTHHAAQRLAERCAARTVEDLLTALREIAQWMLDLANDSEAETLEIPVAGGAGIAIVEMSEKHGPLIKTVLPAGAEVFTQ